MMSVHIRLDGLRPQNIHDVHRLPCGVAANETARVSTFFATDSTGADNEDRMTGSFRGRPLDGKVIHLPEGYSGYVMYEKQKPFSEEDNRVFDVTDTFQKFTQWYLHSQYLSKNTVENATLLWTGKISHAIHDPIKNSIREKDC